MFKVRAKGPPEKVVLYYNHGRRKGGSVFLINPNMPTKKNPRPDGRTDVPIDFNADLMEVVPPETPLTHFIENRPDYEPQTLSGDVVRRPKEFETAAKSKDQGEVSDETPL